jgi:hypothetical protein
MVCLDQDYSSHRHGVGKVSETETWAVWWSAGCSRLPLREKAWSQKLARGSLRCRLQAHSKSDWDDGGGRYRPPRLMGRMPGCGFAQYTAASWKSSGGESVRYGVVVPRKKV